MNEIGGTFKWSEKQVEAYAVAFREGDAIYIEGEGWSDVRSYGGADAVDGSMLEVHRPLSGYAINHIEKSGYVLGYVSGFDNKYKIVTPKDYEVKEGDKLVWLGESDDSRTFGMSYIAAPKGSYFNYKDDNERECVVLAKDVQRWGVIPCYENVKEEKGMNGNDECVGKFKKGDRVKVTGGSYKGSEGSVGQSDEVGGGLSYAVLFDDGRGRWFKEELLELVEKVEKSVGQAEQEAFEYLLTLDKTLVRIFLTDEINDWAKEYMKQKDYNSAKRAIEILEKLEKGE